MLGFKNCFKRINNFVFFCLTDFICQTKAKAKARIKPSVKKISKKPKHY